MSTFHRFGFFAKKLRFMAIIRKDSPLMPIRHSQGIFWAAAVMMLLSICCFEWMYTAFGQEVLHSEVRVATLLFTHMCLFSVFQLFSGSIIDYAGSKLSLPLAALCVFIGMVLQIYTDDLNFPIMLTVSQFFLTFGASFAFIGIGYLCNGFFKESIAGIMFGFAQASYSMCYAIVWYISTYYEQFLKQNFNFLVWSIAAFQFTVFITILCTASNPAVYCTAKKNIKFSDILSSIYKMLFNSRVVLVSLIGGMEFGIFFSVAGVLLYKASATLGSVASLCMWTGFAIGAPFFCWAYSSFLKVKSKHIFLGSSLLQSGSLLLVTTLIQAVEALHPEKNWVAYAACLVASIFGFASGGHMVAFSAGRELVDIRLITTYCAFVNGCMCVLSGIIVLILTLLSQFYRLSDMLLVMSMVALLYYLLVNFMLYTRSPRSNENR